MAALQQTYSGDLSQSIASNIWDTVGDAADDAHEERNRIEAEIIAHNLKTPDRPFDPQFRKTYNVLGHEIKGGDFFGSALKHRFTPNPLGLLGERFHKKDFVGEAHLKGQDTSFASPVGPFPKPRAAWSAKMAGQPFAHVAAGADLKHQVQQQQPTSNPAKGTSPLTSDPKKGFSNTRKKEVLVRDKKLGQFLTAVFQSLSASLLSLNQRMGDNEEALADAKNGMFATQKALEDNSDMLGSKLDSIITALREQNNEIVRAEDNKEVRDRETNIEREKDQSDTERIVKLSQDAEEVEEKNQQDEVQKLLEEQQMELPINTGEDGKGFAEGGIASGPDTGYLAVLHGDEAIVPLDNNVTQGERPAAGTKSIVDMPMLERGNNSDGMKPRVKRLPSIFPKSNMVGDTFITGGSDDVSVQTENLYKAMQLPIKAATIVTMGLLGKILANSPMAGELAEELRQTFAPLSQAAGVDNTVTRSIEKRTIHDSKKSKQVFKEDSFVERTEDRQWWNLFGRFRDWVNEEEGDGEKKSRGGGIGGPTTPIPPPGGGGGLVEWWNKGRNVRVPNETKAPWRGPKGLLADDARQITRTNKAFQQGAKGIRGWNPFKAFSPNMVKTGPTPAVRQAFERPVRTVKGMGIRGGLLGLILNELMNPQPLADGTIEGNREMIELLRSQGEDVTNIHSPALTGVRSNLVKNESEQNIFTKMERRQAQFDINPSIYTQDSASSEEVTEVSPIAIKGDPGLNTYYPPSY